MKTLFKTKQNGWKNWMRYPCFSFNFFSNLRRNNKINHFDLLHKKRQRYRSDITYFKVAKSPIEESHNLSFATPFSACWIPPLSLPLHSLSPESQNNFSALWIEIRLGLQQPSKNKITWFPYPHFHISKY